MHWAAIACVGACVGCAVDARHDPSPQIAVGGDSPLVAELARIAASEGVPIEELAAASWAQERFWFDGDPEPALRADAALVRDGTLAPAIDAALARGIDGRDRDGRRIVVAAERTSGQIADDLDFAGATWAPASTSNYQTGT